VKCPDGLWKIYGCTFCGLVFAVMVTEMVQGSPKTVHLDKIHCPDCRNPVLSPSTEP
jgi:hypothetical protein